jgi:3-hydroxymyristoyl/3-hydroxydecanoyl-(acyl carrier protein) dehydratase
MQHSAAICFAADHPTAAGHFPGNPIIPGALLLDEVVRIIGGVTAIRAAKFFRPVRPGEHVRVDWEAVPGGVKFACRLSGDDGMVASGIVEMAPA